MIVFFFSFGTQHAVIFLMYKFCIRIMYWPLTYSCFMSNFLACKSSIIVEKLSNNFGDIGVCKCYWPIRGGLLVRLLASIIEIFHPSTNTTKSNCTCQVNLLESIKYFSRFLSAHTLYLDIRINFFSC